MFHKHSYCHHASLEELIKAFGEIIGEADMEELTKKPATEVINEVKAKVKGVIEIREKTNKTLETNNRLLEKDIEAQKYFVESQEVVRASKELETRINEISDELANTKKRLEEVNKAKEEVVKKRNELSKSNRTLLDEKYQNYDELMDDLKQPGQPKDLILFYQKIRELTTKLYQLANQEAEKKQTEAGLNQAKSQVLADLKELEGEITDKKITKKITNSWQLAEYVGKVAKIIQAEIIAKEQKATRTAKKELADRENKINDLLENCLVKKSMVVGDLGLNDYAELAIKLDGANLGTQTDADTNGIPDGKTLKQLIDDYNSGQIKITAYEKIIKDDLGFDPASPDLNTQIKKHLGGVELAGVSTDLKKLVDRYNISNDLQGKLSQVEKEALAAQKELEKYQDFVRILAKKIGVSDHHFEKNDLSVLEKDINTEIVENLREKIHVQELIITDYQSGDKYMSKEMISNKMQETLKILKIPTSQYYQLASAQSLPEMGTSFEKLLREEVNQKEKARNKLIKINVILAVLTIGNTVPTPTGGSSEESSAMGETLTEQYYVKEEEKATTNYVPAVAVRRRWRTLSGIIGRKGTGEVNGTPCGAVKCVDIRKNTNKAKAVNYSDPDVEARKRGEQIGLDKSGRAQKKRPKVSPLIAKSKEVVIDPVETMKYQEIEGSLLGDGSLRKAKGYKNVRFSFRHSQVQEEYFLWKAQALQEISSPCSVQKQKADGYSKNEKLLFQSRALEELNDLYNIVSIISNGRKGVLCTDGFTRDAVEILVRYLKHGGIEKIPTTNFTIYSGS
ncbi:20315_t:CDS:10, partial [Racocetra persica]